MSALQEFKKHLKPRQVYRRAQLAEFSNTVDRYIRQLLDTGELQKLECGLYYWPEESNYGDLPPDENQLMRVYLKGDDFLIISSNSYKSIGIGAKQHYNEKLVYNHKRAGRKILGGRKYKFFIDRKFPTTVTEEFLLVDLMNNLVFFAEDKRKMRKHVVEKALSMNASSLLQTANYYGRSRTKKFFNTFL